MTSVNDVQSEFRAFEAEWANVRPYLLRYLPGDRQIGKVDRLLSTAKRYLWWAMRADEKRQILVAF